MKKRIYMAHDILYQNIGYSWEMSIQFMLLMTLLLLWIGYLLRKFFE
ncbi:MAG: hypothetical protein ACTSPI_11095 [Candidatus Heimdallarchaeaceae archaeon]